MEVSGVIDYDDKSLQKINYLKNIIYSFATKLNLKEFDTPVIEKSSLLLGKYGEEVDSKMIFQLKDTDDALRYDQTVPLQRLILEGRLENLRKIQFGKVFRKDKPQPEKGRFREFYQLDIDLVNQFYGELDIFWLIFSVMEQLKVDYQIKYNYKDNLFAILSQAGFTNKSIYPKICSQIDKLDKLSFSQVEEILLSMNLPQENLDKLKELLNSNYLDKSLVDKDTKFKNNLEKFISKDSLKNLVLTPSLARGLDYYTGIIFEVVILNNKFSSSVIAGGEYNKFLYLLNAKGERKYLPAIGVSFGLSRMEKLDLEVKTPDKKKLSLILQKESKDKQIDILYQLRNQLNNDFIIDTNFSSNQVIKEITQAVKNNYQYALIYGEDETKYRLKELFNKNKDLLFDTINDLIAYLKE